ncbi:MAG: dihydrodipicolinate synthase family protein [Clostridium sp.]|nr:dihydrodipicolinate synthase family protein [Clostridium sp.]
MALPPYAIPVTKEAMTDYFREIKANTSAGLMLYHFPGETNVELSPEEIVKMGREGIIDAVKNTTGMEHTMELIVENGHDQRLRISNGFDSLMLAALSCGTDAIITSGANMVPQQFVKIYNYIKNNDLHSARAVYNEIMPLLNLQEAEGSTEPGVCKYCLKLQGIDAGVPRKPVTDISEEAKEAVKTLLKKAEAVLS